MLNYQFDKLFGNSLDKQVAEYVSALMGELSFAQQDVFWQQMRVGPFS